MSGKLTSIGWKRTRKVVKHVESALVVGEFRSGQPASIGYPTVSNASRKRPIPVLMSSSESEA